MNLVPKVEASSPHSKTWRSMRRFVESQHLQHAGAYRSHKPGSAGILAIKNPCSRLSASAKKSPLWFYGANSPGLFKCPADTSVVTPSSGPYAGRTVPRVRSRSMNYWFGGQDGTDMFNSSGPGWSVYLRGSDLIEPGPASTILFIDTRED